MKSCKKNSEVVCMLGDLVEALYQEVDALPLSDVAKSALVMVTLSDLTSRKGQMIYFQLPPKIMEDYAAA